MLLDSDSSSEDESEDVQVRQSGRITWTLRCQDATVAHDEGAGARFEDGFKEGLTLSSGMVIMAHLQGNPWWPAKIIRRSGDRLFVYFYGPERKKWDWVKTDDAKLFNEKSAQLILSRFGASGRNDAESRRHMQSNALKIATEEALADFERLSPTLRSAISAAATSMLNDSFNEDLCYMCGQGGLLILCDR